MNRRGCYPVLSSIVVLLALTFTATPAAAQVPGPPTSLTGSFVNNILSLQWTGPGGPVTHFLVEVGSGPGLADLGTFNVGLLTSVGIPNPPAGSFWFRVRAANGAQVGPPSNEISGTIQGGQGAPGPCAVPGAPTNLTATVVDSTLTLNWNAPATGGPVVSYVVIARIPGQPDISLPVGAATTVSQGGLPAGTAQIVVRALNACGAGPLSNQVDVTIGGGAPAPNPNPGPAPGPGGPREADPPPGTRLPVPSYLRNVVEQVAAAFPGDLRNSCVEHGGNNTWLFRLVQALRQISTRWGLNWKRGNRGDMSQDVVDFHHGPGPDEDSTEVYIFDVISGHCGANPGPNWADVTQATRDAGTIGRWTLAGRQFNP
jgi:hypothetical protein